MNFYAPAHGQTDKDRMLFRVGAAIALSIVAHGLLLFAYRQGAMPPWRNEADAPREALVVRLRAPEPKPQALPVPEAPPVPKAEPKPQRKPATAAVERAARKASPATARTAAPDVIALPDDKANEPAAPGAFTVAPPGAPRFDPDAARKFAREIATQPDPARAGMAVAQIPPKPYATETKAARLIAGAKRSNCKDGIPGGLLAPLVLLLDKKDSGCKW
ncbi:hypothetical protein [Massilia antarctica]|uniref:hypothetical protein n=1 Tax=Massilia antarctica TaxID=2765360 RepID=UPI0006BB58C1|nr:hypothetical protein [Massilia sp. H27-R4]MCY0915750.1 hypothetical protein [Massilia sp. H27-R4]CUI06207.1 hypothetical protein BN2497_7191 [Janthinobacterium sp. CG23_2]CUU29993.1 hypothetical protein BN3177_7191 [Janthinobacterium sp. CG23_2]